eukprot:gene53626-60639_t
MGFPRAAFAVHIILALSGFVLIMASSGIAYRNWWVPLQCFPFKVPESASTGDPEWCDGSAAHSHAAVGSVLLFLVMLEPMLGVAAPLCC